jgi:hypothetical protein
VQDTQIIEQTFATKRDLEQMFQSVINQVPRDSAGVPRICEVGAFIAGHDCLDTAIFPDLVVSVLGQEPALRPFSARSFPELSLSADPSTGALLMKLRANVCDQGSKPPVFFDANYDVFTNKTDLWDTFPERKKSYLAEVGFSPGMTLKQWAERIKEVVPTESRTVYEADIRYTHDLPVLMKFGTIGTSRSFHAAAEYIAKSLLLTEYKVPGDTSFGYASAHIHPERQQLAGPEATLARRLGEDKLRQNPSLAEVRDALHLGTEMINRYPSMTDVMTTIDSQYENAKIMRPQVQTSRQYQELALVIVSVSANGIVLGSKTFCYYNVAKAGEVEKFDQLIVSAYESIRSEKYDLGLILEAMQEISRYTTDEMPEFMGRNEAKYHEGSVVSDATTDDYTL